MAIVPKPSDFLTSLPVPASAQPTPPPEESPSKQLSSDQQDVSQRWIQILQRLGPLHCSSTSSASCDLLEPDKPAQSYKALEIGDKPAFNPTTCWQLFSYAQTAGFKLTQPALQGL